jgi:hypothetical protein
VYAPDLRVDSSRSTDSTPREDLTTTSIRAEYKGTAPLEAKSTYTLTGENDYSTGVRKANLVFNYNYVDANEIVEAGILFAPKGGKTEAELKAALTTDVANVARLKAKGTGNVGMYAITPSLTSAEAAAATVTAIGYVIYTDENGELAYAYSNMVTLAPAK